jgi:hypothetical protein
LNSPSTLLLKMRAQVPAVLLALRVRCAACDGCVVPEMPVNGVPQSQYDVRTEK